MKPGSKHSAATRAKMSKPRPSYPGAWTPAEDAILGTVPDAEVSARLGRSRGSVAARRHKLGIASPSGRGRPQGSTGIPWHPALKGPRSNKSGSPSA